MLAFSRMPGNAFSFWIRRTLRWSRGRPSLAHEPKHGLFGYLSAPDGLAESAAEAREADLRRRYDLEALARQSTQALYRKNLYLIDILEKAAEGLPIPLAESNSTVTAMDIGSQDWHYVFGLERWLRHAAGSGKSGKPRDTGGSDDFAGRKVSLRGIEVDGYGIYPDFRSRKDYAEAYCAQTGNPYVTYEIGDALDSTGGGLDLITIFYPFVTRHHLLLWGLPLRFFRPAQMLAKAASLLRPGGWLLVFTHTLKEHELFLELGKGEGSLQPAKEGRAESNLVDFHEDVTDRRYSVWKRRP
jgi:hypothetical protein